MTTELGLPNKVALTALAILGAGVQTYDPMMPRVPSDRLSVPQEERDLDPNLPEKVTLSPDEYDLLLKAHEKAIAAVEKERKKPYFSKLSQKEQAAEIDALYKDEFGVEKDAILLDAVDRASR
jgi:hypothetical protein